MIIYDIPYVVPTLTQWGSSAMQSYPVTCFVYYGTTLL